MVTSCLRRGLTKIELIVLIAVIGLGVLIPIPFIQRSREFSRQATCTQRMKNQDIGFANYASTFSNAFPAAGQLIKPADGNPPYKIGGYSFVVGILLFDDQFIGISKQIPSERDLPGGSVVLAGTNSMLPRSMAVRLAEATSAIIFEPSLTAVNGPQRRHTARSRAAALVLMDGTLVEPIVSLPGKGPGEKGE